GLLPPDSGEVRYDGMDVAEVPPGERRIGMVFQGYALYPHVTSRRNVLSYFMFRRKTPALDALAEAKYRRTADLMGVELTALLDRKPPTLSGGEKQRVALGRCITRDATVFLVDEPFANLDQALREKYRVNLKLLLREFGITTVYVTHDHHEALVLGDRLAIMNAGRLEQVGTAEELYHEPDNAFVAGFLSLQDGVPPISLLDPERVPGGAPWPAHAQLGVRPRDVRLLAEPGPQRLPGVVAERLPQPLTDTTLFVVRVGDQPVHALLTGPASHAVGERVWLGFERFHLFDKASGARLRGEPAAR
ncbi:MAG TPA: ABC transporter ATP-binding protein, partial [Methylomirabilota bacterium]|nr:ABC transporter ATP-binding protein [Methylomirabilota bacterium]